MTFKTSLDNFAKFVTIQTTILFLAIIISQTLLFKDELRPVQICIIVALPLVLLGTFLFRPIDYSMVEDKLIVHRAVLDIKIRYKQIQSVEQIDKEKLKWSIRTSGVGGLFGYWGQSFSLKMGRMTWYATRRNNAVLIITTRNKKILLTPDEPERFVAELSLRTSSAANQGLAALDRSL